MTAMNPDGERAGDEHDRQSQSERRDQQQRLNAGHRLPATAADPGWYTALRPRRPARRRHPRSNGNRTARFDDGRLPLVPCCADEGQKIGLAEQADEPRCAVAVEASGAVDALAAIATGRRPAFVDVLRAVATGKAGRARAPEVVDQLRAGAAVGARSRQALVDVVLTEGADVAGRAAALEVVRAVDAAAAVQARVDVGALVTVDLAPVAGETRRANATETAAGVQARATLSTQHTPLLLSLALRSFHHLCQGVCFRRWLQLRFDFDSTAIRPPFDSHSTAVLRPLADLYVTTVSLPVCGLVRCGLGK